MNNIYHIHEANPFCVQAVAEHRVLHAAFEQIRAALKTCCAAEATQAAVDEATRRIQKLRDGLAEHFRQEEDGGYLEEAAARNPPLAPQAEALQAEHRVLLKMADALLADARRAEPPPAVWNRLNNDYQQFEQRLRAHEAAEEALLQRAFNEDLGG